MSRRYFVYLLTNRNNTVLYTGISGHLRRRIYQHKNKLMKGFTHKYNCSKLVYYEETDEVDIAIAREKQIKGWVRSKKDQLINEKNPEWRDLAEDWF